MSVIVTLDLRIYGVNSVTSLLGLLKECGWSWHNSEGKVEYIPLYDADGSDWQTKIMKDSELFELVNQKEALGEKIGIRFFTRENIGVTFHASDVHMIGFMLSNNRVKLKDEYIIGVTDVNWYIKNIVWKLIGQGVRIESIEYSEY